MKLFGLKVLPGDLVKSNAEDIVDDKCTPTADDGAQSDNDEEEFLGQAVTEFGQ